MQLVLMIQNHNYTSKYHNCLTQFMFLKTIDKIHKQVWRNTKDVTPYLIFFAYITPLAILHTLFLKYRTKKKRFSWAMAAWSRDKAQASGDSPCLSCIIKVESVAAAAEDLSSWVDLWFCQEQKSQSYSLRDCEMNQEQVADSKIAPRKVSLTSGTSNPLKRSNNH